MARRHVHRGRRESLAVAAGNAVGCPRVGRVRGDGGRLAGAAGRAVRRPVGVGGVRPRDRRPRGPRSARSPPPAGSRCRCCSPRRWACSAVRPRACGWWSCAAPASWPRCWHSASGRAPVACWPGRSRRWPSWPARRGCGSYGRETSSRSCWRSCRGDRVARAQPARRSVRARRAGRPGRPEAWLMVGGYAAYLWRVERRSWPLAVGVPTMVTLWIVPDWIGSGDPLHALHGAQPTSFSDTESATALSRGAGRSAPAAAVRQAGWRSISSPAPGDDRHLPTVLDRARA
jgi:hypothetical protein